MEIKILRIKECQKCRLLRERLEQVLKELGLNVPIGYPKDMDDFLSYGVAQTPALVINGKIKSMGKVPLKNMLKRLIQEEI